ncbi:MAG: aminotransferase class I/II-fold pyridoxal phosphate-dependent enzyme [Bacteroidetes bacterium]|nr:aminotransferase class I/II-fold pyridoxal phosphate-dependent enzyme [Bacteroidota bacterium]
MTPKHAQRIDAIEPSIFSTMSQLAAEHRAVNLGQGFPDFDGPEWIVEAFIDALRSEKNQYAPMTGVQRLRRAIAGYQQQFYGLDWNAESEITVTAGATESLFSVMLALLDPGDEVILFEPYYDGYHANALIAGAVPVCVTLQAPDFRIVAETLEAAVTPRTRMIVLNNPHNPTGRVFSPDELAAVADTAKRHDLIVLSDEVYEFLLFDGRMHIPIATLPGMRERTVTVSSTGKTFGMTGWKIGYTIAREEITRAVRTVHQFVTFAVNTPGQHAMAHGLERLETYLPAFRALYQDKRDLLFDGLRDSALAAILPEASYFMMVRLPEGSGGDVAYATRLVTEQGVAVIPPSVFYSNSDEGTTMLRLCFAKKDETIREGVRRLRRCDAES